MLGGTQLDLLVEAAHQLLELPCLVNQRVHVDVLERRQHPRLELVLYQSTHIPNLLEVDQISTAHLNTEAAQGQCN